MMSTIMLQVLKTSLFTSLLIGLLLLLVPLLQKRYKAGWRYFAWLVIALRLLVPVNFTLPQAPIRIELPTQPTIAAVTPPSEERPYVQVDWGDTITLAPGGGESPVDVTTPDTIAINPLIIAGGIWLAGMLAFLLFQIVSYQVFLRKLRISKTENVPVSFKETVWRIGVEMGICKLPEAVVTPAIDAPVLIGVLHPRVLLPHTKYSDEEFAFILRHELVHYRRRDMWYKLVLMLANALHWFNPLIYLMTVQAAKDIELACDDEVTRELDQNARAKYGDTILSALPRKRRLEPVFSTHFGSTKENIKGRLRNMFDMAVKRRGIAALCAVVVCALTITGVATIGNAAAVSGSIPAVAGGYPFSVPSIEAGKVFCIGKVELEPNAAYKVTLSVESGNGWFVGLHNSPDITIHARNTWEQEFVMGSNFVFRSGMKKTAYLYVGSHSDGGTRLTGISGKVLSPGQPPHLPIPDGIISANANDGTWAAASGIEGKTWDEQINMEIKWLEDTYKEHNTSFVITETLPKTEASDVSRINYLYENSDVFRSMSQMKNGAFTIMDHESFSRSALPDGQIFDRIGVMMDSDAYLQIDAKYNLTEGKMTIWLVNPSGKRVYWGDLTRTYNEQFTVQGEKGLWSVILVSEADNGAVSGTSRIIFKTVDIKTQTASTSSSSNMLYSTQYVADEITALTGSNNVTVKSIEAGEVTCIGKIELGPDSAYTATVSVESGSGAMIALHDSPNVTKHAGTGWNLHYGAGSNIYFSSEEKKTAYVYVGSMFDGTKLTNVKVNLVQTKSPVSPKGNPYFQIKSNGKSILHSGSFEAQDGQTLIIANDISIKKGSVELFLFSPSGKEQRFIFGDNTDANAKGEIKVPLSSGTWAYNCTGFFESGNAVITGTITGDAQGKSTAADKAAYEVMRYSRSWMMVEYMLPYMTRDGIDATVQLNNELNPSSKKIASDYYGLTTPSKTESNQRSYALMEKSGNWTYSSPLFPYMTNEGIDRVVTLYNQKTGKNVKAADYYN